MKKKRSTQNIQNFVQQQRKRNHKQKKNIYFDPTLLFTNDTH